MLQTYHEAKQPVVGAETVSSLFWTYAYFNQTLPKPQKQHIQLLLYNIKIKRVQQTVQSQITAQKKKSTSYISFPCHFASTKKTKPTATTTNDNKQETKNRKNQIEITRNNKTKRQKNKKQTTKKTINSRFYFISFLQNPSFPHLHHLRQAGLVDGQIIRVPSIDAFLVTTDQVGRV